MAYPVAEAASIVRPATFTLLFILSGVWMLSTAEHALAKPYGPPSWVILNGPGLPQDVFLSIDKAAAFGTFETNCISAPRQATPPWRDWTGWQMYEATIFYAMSFESGRQAFVTKQTLYISGGSEGIARIHSDMTILDQAGQATGWGDCREKWVPLTWNQLAVVMEHVDRYSNIQRMMVFGCRWAGPEYGNPYQALTRPSCL